MLVLSRFRPRVTFPALFAVALGIACSTPAPAQAPSLSARLEVVHVDAARTQALVRFTLKNDGKSRVQFLKWHTPFEGFRSALFDVVCGGRAVDYRGPIVKRGTPSPNDYLEITPGQSLQVTVDLAAVYDLPSGDCVVTFAGAILDAVTGDSPPREARATSRRLTLQVNSVTLSAGGGGNTSTLAGLTYTGCSAGQQATLAVAVPAGGGLASASQTYLNSVSAGSRPTNARYITWFGAYEAGRYSTVTNRYGQISAAAAGTLTLNCTGSGSCGGVTTTCDPGDFAFTCAGGVGQTIWLCSGFFAAPATGYNSQAGTIVHELSHWYGTRDYAYGCSSCQTLAVNDAVQASANADNCEYFAENFGLVCP